MITPTTNSTTNELLSEQHYYPFGMAMNGPWVQTGGDGDLYRYNGKELNEDLGLYDYGARWYDPAIARFTTVDPLAEQFADQSLYHYAYNDPVLFIDPDGRSASSPIFDPDGNFLGTDSEGYTGEILVMDASMYNNLTGNGWKTLDHGAIPLR